MSAAVAQMRLDAEAMLSAPVGAIRRSAPDRWASPATWDAPSGEVVTFYEGYLGYTAYYGEAGEFIGAYQPTPIQALRALGEQLLWTLAERRNKRQKRKRTAPLGGFGSARRMGPGETHTEVVQTRAPASQRLTSAQANMALDVLEMMTREDEAQHALEQARRDLKYGQEWQDDHYVRIVANLARRAAIELGRAQTARQEAESALENSVGLPAEAALQMLSAQRPDLLALPPRR